MIYDFDLLPERAGSGSYKWDMRAAYTSDPDILPLWVADMDFQAPPAVIAALIERAQHGVFGYPVHSDAYLDSIVAWNRDRHNWPIERDWLLHTPGIVTALHMAVQAFSAPDDSVVIQSPVYHPFRFCAEHNGRRAINNLLRLENGRYRMDLEQLERVIDDKTRLLLLCSPHNPVGRVWEESELRALGRICLQHKMTIISDEIHADLIMPGHRQIPLASLDPEIAAHTVTLCAPSKTFNIPGLQTAYAVIANPDLRNRFAARLDANGIHFGNIFGLIAAEAAYRHGHEWLKALLVYIQGNYDFLRVFCAEHLPKVTVAPLEGTYLVWADFQAYGLGDEALRQCLQKKAHVWFTEGPIFGQGGSGFQRINIGCPRHLLAEALTRVAHALNNMSV